MKKTYFCCEDISKIENYELALKESFRGWDLHHRLGTHTSDGERRLVNLSVEELIALNMYWRRPASELIFLPAKDHQRLHKIGKKRGPMSEEQKKKISDSNKGRTLSIEHKKKLRQAYAKRVNKTPMKGKHHSDETKKKMSEAWDYNKHFTTETRKKISDGVKRSKLS